MTPDPHRTGTLPASPDLDQETVPEPEDSVEREEKSHRDVVSFVRRGERLSQGRQNAWDRLSPFYVIDPPRGHRDTLPAEGIRLDPAEVFGRKAELVVEVGSGTGDNIVAAALAHPERDHLGAEVYLPGLAQTLSRVERSGSPRNLRMLPLDAQRALPAMLAEGSIDELWVYFADPWPKQRHHKRRLVSPGTAALVASRLQSGGTWRLATDWPDYAEQMLAVLDAEPGLEGGVVPRWEERPVTRFERKGLADGRPPTDLAYRRPGSSSATSERSSSASSSST